jgi:uncharacterized protein
MSNHFVPRVGAVLSADIAVPEHEREVRFYSRVLCTGERPLWREQDLMNSMGMPIIGLGERSEVYANLPLQWMPHIQVADVGASARRAVDLGGSEVMHFRDDDGRSQWAVLLDPDGAAFGIIPLVSEADVAAAGVDQSATTDPPGPVGRIAWLDLTVPDAETAREFYREVVGWSVEELAMSDGDDRYPDFVMKAEDGTAAAGVCHARGPNAALPPVWMIYLPVGDMDESLRRVEEEGGAVITAMRSANGSHAYAAVRDPVGAHFALVPAEQ